MSAKRPVLIVEDDPMFRKILCTWLESWGYQVSVAEDGAMAWEMLQGMRAPHLLTMRWVSMLVFCKSCSRRMP